MDQPDSENEWLVDLPVNILNRHRGKHYCDDTGCIQKNVTTLVTVWKRTITSPSGEVKSIGKFLATREY